MSAAKDYTITNVNKENLTLEQKKLVLGQGFWNFMYYDTSNNRSIHKFYYLMSHFHELNGAIKSVAVPQDGSGKLSYNYIDLQMGDNGLVSFIPSEKYPTDVNIDGFWKHKARQTMKFGRFIKAFFHPELLKREGITDVDIERISGIAKAKTSTEDFEFEIISGDKIKWAYHYLNYTDLQIPGDNASSSLTGSCMRYDMCQDWLDLYTSDESIKMLILKHTPTGKVAARALLWHGVTFKEKRKEEVQINFMDRVYAYREWMINYMLDWGTANGYYRKYQQSINNKLSFYRPTGELVDGDLKYVAASVHKFFPYMDTFTYLMSDRVTFVNNEDLDVEYTLNDYKTGNSGVNNNATCRCYHCEERFTEDDVTTVNGNDVCDDCLSENYQYSDRHQCYINDNENNYVSGIGYVYSHETVYDEASGEYILESDAIEAMDRSNNWIWTHRNNTVLLSNGDYYVSAHDDIIHIDGDWHHISDTFECDHDGIIYLSGEHMVSIDCIGVRVHEDNLEAYMAGNNLVYNDSGDIIINPGNTTDAEPIVAEVPVLAATPAAEIPVPATTPVLASNHTEDDFDLIF